MKEMMMRFINPFGAKSIKYLLADREFMSKEWLDFLIERQINFAIPLKDMKIRIKKSLQTKAASQSFKHLQQFEYVEVEAVYEVT
ncbi:IS4 family transposase domain protein [Rickettsiales endosymbiont of Paramecium tredecaurelia]|uniref:transposase n=1 Tax=Candidatus Sarmatiella mevalonica TaxID=2770581 RepID=UPI0019242C57|nr:transposase [Candidatus Sarmatiella mevalonica]MBL3284656.1 IS4 family transposase domain protein [Candidatus Sarmatiella mevalonica]